MRNFLTITLGTISLGSFLCVDCAQLDNKPYSFMVTGTPLLANGNNYSSISVKDLSDKWNVNMVKSDLYKQALSKSSTGILKDFETLVAAMMADFKQNPELATSAAYRRKKANQFFLDHNGPIETVANLKDFSVKSDLDNAKIPVRLYSVGAGRSKNLLMFVHGGGCVQGNLETHDYLCRKLANALSMDVLAVDYRLAPENKFPTPLNDVESAYKYCLSQDYENVLIAGDSGGGNLCAALCIKLHEHNLQQPYAALLFYPSLSNDFESKSYKAFGDCAALTTASVKYFTNTYAGSPCDQEPVLSNKLIYPNLEKDLSFFPRTIMLSSGYDVLLDGQIELKERLEKLGKPVYQFIRKGAVHGYMTYGSHFDKEISEDCKKLRNSLSELYQ